ncbi:phoshoprotein 300, putative [Perkinsus marinus ATCC 50983]|uniref:Phoshoprotein 300, putative n=1 Tax=Perkinsus marinus (strain ATCC 50983 / TXsc) TaxID=423536 RepID=C5LIL8_PERM5|nr:phoshoprotein 300, putative [Perkinsus marinus ATCC 50983]EER03421.1 phoshoprotein 300, putative [Perkinsus marinus ATCC 50983]|eukprot:XP_002771605.1 phoshoprotein 300, putative [Perkinsus marinus ATCC 50983]
MSSKASTTASNGGSSAGSRAGEKGHHSTHRSRHQIRERNREVAARANAELRNEKLKTLDKDALNKLGILRNANMIQATLAVDYQFHVDTPVPDSGFKVVPMEVSTQELSKFRYTFGALEPVTSIVDEARLGFIDLIDPTMYAACKPLSGSDRAKLDPEDLALLSSKPPENISLNSLIGNSTETPGVDTTAVGKVTSVEPPESRETSPAASTVYTAHFLRRPKIMANDIFLDTGHDRVTEVLELQKKQQKKKAEKIDVPTEREVVDVAEKSFEEAKEVDAEFGKSRLLYHPTFKRKKHVKRVLPLLPNIDLYLEHDYIQVKFDEPPESVMPGSNGNRKRAGSTGASSSSAAPPPPPWTGAVLRREGNRDSDSEDEDVEFGCPQFGYYQKPESADPNALSDTPLDKGRSFVWSNEGQIRQKGDEETEFLFYVPSAKDKPAVYGPIGPKMLLRKKQSAGFGVNGKRRSKVRIESLPSRPRDAAESEAKDLSAWFKRPITVEEARAYVSTSKGAPEEEEKAENTSSKRRKTDDSSPANKKRRKGDEEEDEESSSEESDSESGSSGSSGSDDDDDSSSSDEASDESG